MTPFVLSCVPKADIDLLERIRLLVQSFPDGVDYGKDAYGDSITLSCHILAHAVGRVLSLDAEDGYFRPNYSHSWLKTPNGHILDVYPVGILSGPFLVEQTMSFMSPGRHLYQPDERTWNLVAKPDMQKAIRLATEIMERLAKELKL